ncbi:hypothetical protein K504DRAFT_461425 [Pleomassaria siparia CBS 279.74]|uniref:Uncharacterized protein n=1 Tax=Pleomassaria siparia CBS 279.74 TaxID=1314801 RepID=A0A6G1KJX7_9PLEO|nr:hypothetical protein K504DRAFT_461425 [Pleomassaria siparia CBS 279.74]
MANVVTICYPEKRPTSEGQKLKQREAYLPQFRRYNAMVLFFFFFYFLLGLSRHQSSRQNARLRAASPSIVQHRASYNTRRGSIRDLGIAMPQIWVPQPLGAILSPVSRSAIQYVIALDG